MSPTRAGNQPVAVLHPHSTAPADACTSVASFPQRPRFLRLWPLLILVSQIGLRPLADVTDSPQRSLAGLQALYTFDDILAETSDIQDRSGVSKVTLQIPDRDAVHIEDGVLSLVRKTTVRSSKSATPISDSIRLSGRVSIELWIQTATLDQSGPARILTLSPNTSQRNITLGQDGNKLDIRLRTTETTDNGIPSFESHAGALGEGLTHVVFTRDRAGRSRLYINGELNKEQRIPGTTVNWDGSYRLGLGNELSNDRPWLGSFHLVALYNRDLLPDEVQRHFEIGPNPTTPNPSTLLAATEEGFKSGKSDTPSEAHSAHLFTTRVAPILSRHCLECHDASTKKGTLDLSSRDAIFGHRHIDELLQAGNPDASELWRLVASDEMPAERPPMSDSEKAVLKSWIETGAVWSLSTIDPAAHRLSRSGESTWIRRLTVPEYVETVRSAVGVEIEEEAKELLPADIRADGFRNTAYSLGVDLTHVEAYSELAELIVSKLDVPGFLSRFNPQETLKFEHFPKVIQEMGHWLLRGPVEADEERAFQNVIRAVAEVGGSPEEAGAVLIEAMLQAPRFIYRIENQRGDGRAWPVTDYELASRLSYILWGAPPDKELMQAAESGQLYDRRQIAAQVDRMLQDPRVRQRSLQFVIDWLDLDRLQTLRPNRERFPEWSSELAQAMRTETLLFFEDLVWEQQRPLGDLFNAQFTHADDRLAKFYGLEPKDTRPVRYDLSDVPHRGGLLTQGSLLTVGGDEASMVTRGLFVLNDMLRGAVNNPPPGLDTQPVHAEPGLSRRAIAEERVQSNACGVCHGRFEPLAYALEKYNGIGAHMSQDEYGNRVQEHGRILFPGEAESRDFQTTAELMDLLAGHDRVRETLSRKVIQFAIGRPLTTEDAPIVSRIHREAAEAGGSYTHLIRAIVLSDLVLTVRTATE